MDICKNINMLSHWMIVVTIVIEVTDNHRHISVKIDISKKEAAAELNSKMFNATFCNKIFNYFWCDLYDMQKHISKSTSATSKAPRFSPPKNRSVTTIAAAVPRGITKWRLTSDASDSACLTWARCRLIELAMACRQRCRSPTWTGRQIPILPLHNVMYRYIM